MKKILHTIYTGFSAVVVMALTLASCIDDELVKNNNVVEGVPITVTMNLSGKATADVTVETKASGDDLSDLTDIVLFIFHGDGTFENVVTNYGNYSSLEVKDQPSDSGNRLYNVTFKTTSGTKRLIAVANVASGIWGENLLALIREAYNGGNGQNFDTVLKKVAMLRQDILDAAVSADGVQPFHVTSASQLFISGWNQNVVFGTNNNILNYGDYGENPVAVKMNRAMAHITFNIKENQSTDENYKGTFTPTSYRVYNIPTKSYLTNDTQGKDFWYTSDIDEIAYIYTASENIGTAENKIFSFNFYMPENVQVKGSIPAEGTYQYRDKWKIEGESVSGASPDKKKWYYAPQNSTFVVISGTYSGNATIDGNNDQPVIANVDYTIHLGDFSNDGSLNDFSVERNVSYTYNVEVKGVDNIYVEATSDREEQSGAEGSIYDNTNVSYTYNLDAHYEQVYLSYNLSSIAEAVKSAVGAYDAQTADESKINKAISDQLVLIIQSEAMDYTHESTTEKPYTTRNKRGTLSPYLIYANAGAGNAKSAKEKVLLDTEGTGLSPKGGFDYKWIEFYPQQGTGISDYPGISEWAMESLNDVNNKDFYENADGKSNGAQYLMDVYDIIVAMGNVVKKIYKGENISTVSYNEGGIKDVDFFTGEGITITNIGDTSNPVYVARFTAFVNEYYYLHHPLTGAVATMWAVMTNKIPREMIIAMSTETSEDGNSSYSQIHSYISQLSMQTFYSDRAEESNINAFGIETYNETPLTFTFYGNNNGNNVSHATDYKANNIVYSDLDWTYGQENQKRLIGTYNGDTRQWGTYVIATNNGWTSSVGTEHTKHKLPENAYNVKAAYSACMSRNRDLNGNGNIDDNEIRWYLASLNEYIRMGIGATAISSAAQLYTGDKSQMTHSGYAQNFINQGSLFYTSSPYDARIYWAVEKGSYGEDGLDYVGGFNTPKPIRCIRALPAITDNSDISRVSGIQTDATYVYHERTDLRPAVLEFRHRLVSSLYRDPVYGSSLAKHDEDEPANRFYDGIYVANSNLTQRYSLGEIIGFNDDRDGFTTNYGGTMVNPCASYYESFGTETIRGWRVPNLVELSAMNAAGLLTTDDTGTASCTQFSNPDVRYGFARSSLMYCPGTNNGDINSEFLIRCVRDVPDGFEFPAN